MIVILHFLIHWMGADYGAPYGHLQPYDVLSGLLGIGLIGAVAELIRRVQKHHIERMAQTARHHKERMAQAEKHHINLKRHISDQLGSGRDGG